MGGAWCFINQDYLAGLHNHDYDWAFCYSRSKTTWPGYAIGTTNGLTENINDNIDKPIGGILSNDPKVNKEFHNWNHVFVVYCDGFSFAGDRYFILLVLLETIIFV